MVKVNFWEQLAIYVLVFLGVSFLLSQFDISSSIKWFLFLILVLGISEIIIKLIKGKETLTKEEKEREEKLAKFGKWWKKLKTYEKVLIILVTIVFAMMFFGIFS
jgi:hypothetical protein